MSDLYFRGTVESYSDDTGFGIVTPDEPSRPGEKYVLLRKSLRDRAAVLTPGIRVQFRKEIVPMGTLVTDVHEEAPLNLEVFETPELERGKVTFISSKRRFGFISSGAEGGNVWFHLSALSQPALPLSGSIVEFERVVTSKGPQARSVTVIEGTTPQSSAVLPSESHDDPPRTEAAQETGTLRAGLSSGSDILAQAILARYGREFDKAAALYRRGMKESPSVQLILSYAAMEKNRNRKAEAMRVYEEGLVAFPGDAKLAEDAGVLAASINDFPRAIRLLEKAVTAYRSRGVGREKQALQWLARAHYQRGSHHELREAIKCFEQMHALHSPRSREARTLSGDTLLMNLAKIRTQHSRGAITFKLLTDAGCIIRRAELHDVMTRGADLIVEFQNQELKESYGLSDSHIVMRCMFQATVDRYDLDSFDDKIKSLADAGLVDEQIALLVVGSLSENLQRVLFNRIEDRKKAQPAIIPLTQAEIESAPDAVALLRDVFNRWLYRRDLFLLNSPVVGRRFFGRGKQLTQLRDTIANGTSSGVFGLRKVGKTSLLKETARRSSESGDVVVLMDLLTVPSDIEDARWVYWKIATQLNEQCAKLGLRHLRWRLGEGFADFFDIPSSFPVATAFDADLTSLLKSLRTSNVTPKPKVVLLLDEIERLLPNEDGKSGFSGFFDFLGYLRGVSQETPDFVLIITGANAAVAEVGQFGGRDNPVFNFFNEIYLPLLERTECDLMIRSLGRGMGLQFTSAAFEYIYELTGGHPFFARQLCSFVAGQYHERPAQLSDAHFASVMDSYIEFCGKDFREIVERLERDYPSELRILKKLATKGGVAAVADFRDTAIEPSLKHLLGYQLVRLQGATVSLSMDLFRRWLIRSVL